MLKIDLNRIQTSTTMKTKRSLSVVKKIHDFSKLLTFILHYSQKMNLLLNNCISKPSGLLHRYPIQQKLTIPECLKFANQNIFKTSHFILQYLT